MPAVFALFMFLFAAAPAAIIEAQPDAPQTQVHQQGSHHVKTPAGDSIVSD